MQLVYKQGLGALAAEAPTIIHSKNGKSMNKNVRRLTLAAAVGLAIAGSNAMAEEMEEIVVKGDLGSLPGERKSQYGFEKSILETPRSASTVSEEMMDRFNMADIDELVAVAPGTFTQSFFGVASSLMSEERQARPISEG